MASMSARVYAALVATLLICALCASAASAQEPPTIRAVDTPNQAWQPNTTTVPTGSTVRWAFDQAQATHTITSQSGNWTLDQTRAPGGDAVEYTFNAPGTYNFFCKIHPAMTGTVTVQDVPRYDVLVYSRTPAGAFRHTDAIDAGRTAIQAMGTAQNFRVVLTEDQTQFSDANLRQYEVVVLLNAEGTPNLNGAQRTAFERWMQRGGGVVGIHSASFMDTDWKWYGDMMGDAFFKNHPAGANQFQTATVKVEDANHPAMQGIPANWVRQDEWYNFTAEPRGKVHVLATLDESTYVEEDGSDGVDDDHPIIWCSNYDRGRSFYTALGHMGSYWQEPLYRSHIQGAIEWASGKVAGDCGAQRDGLPTDASFDKVTLDDNTENPMEIAVAPDRDVYYVELAGRVKHYDAQTRNVRAIGQIPVHRGNENGLLGITLDPNFAVNHWLYLFYSAPTPEEQHVSRFTLLPNGNIDMTSEKVLLRIPHQRIVCCHSSGSLTFGPDGNLYISTGDDTEHAASQGYAPLDDDVLRDNPGDNPDADRAYDSRRTSGNTFDLRGKILRIHPETDGTYTIPPGNLFPPFQSDPTKTRPEIYTMGHRNPFRIQVDSETGWLYNGEVGPDANGENANRGPRGYDEINQIRQAGNMGWPYCIADNKPYREWTFPSGPAGPEFDCANGPTNTSNYNTGLTQLPPARSALLWWPYTPYPTTGFPWGTEPTAVPAGPGRTAIAGPTYHYNGANASETKFPQWYDDKVFFADWSRDWIATMTLNAAGQPVAIDRFMQYTDFRHPHDIEMGPDGALYVLEWGRDFNYAGAGINPDSGLYRIDFVKGARSPVAKASSDKDSGPVPLTVNFSSAGSEDPDGDPISYEWDFGDGSPVSSVQNPQHTYTTAGTYTAKLTVTDSTNKAATSTVIINAGNTRPTVQLEIPAQGGVYGWGDAVGFKVNVTDPEDGTIDCSRVEVFPGIYHDEGGNAHVHPGVSKSGCEGTFDIDSESGHAKSANIAVVLTAIYTDKGGAGGSAPLEGADTRKLNPKQVQAEHFTAQSGLTVTDRPLAEGGRRLTSAAPNDWLYFEPLSLKGITGLTFHYTSTGAGGLVDVRLDSPTGPVVGTADLLASGGQEVPRDITATITPADDAPHRVYLVFRQRTGGPANNLVELDELTWIGKGVASDSAPLASIQTDVTSGPTPLTVTFTGNGTDPEGTALTYKWDFDDDGEVDATTKDATYTYTENKIHTARLTVTDAGGRSGVATVRIDAYPPVGGCPGDDDFSGTSLNRTIWPEVVRETPADLTVGGGTMNLQVRQPDIFGTGNTGMQNIVLQPLPASGPWTATTRMTWNPTTNFQNSGLLVYASDSAWIKFNMVWNAGRKFEFYKETNDSPVNLFTTGTLPADFPTTFQVRLVSNGTNIIAQYSPDGQAWTTMGSAVTNLNGLANPRIGLYGTAGGTTTGIARFDWFKLDTPVDPNDEFNGDALDLCKWTEIIRPDPAQRSVQGGHLVLPAAHGDFFAVGANNNPNILLQQPPSGPWTATTRMRFVPNENYEQAGIVVYGDDANYAKLDLVHANGRAVEFLRESNDIAAGFGGTVGLPTSFPEWIWLRVVSDGTTLRSSYRTDDGQWIQFGEPAPLSGVPNARVGLYANDSNATVATRDEARFDFFHLVAGTPDTTPPVTTAAVAPDPVAGWNRGNVTVTLSTEAGATTEYKLGSGAYQNYSGPITVSDEGTTVVTFRSRDGEGNLEAEKTVTVKIDKTAPTSSASPNGGTFTAPVQVTLSGADAAGGSGLDKLEYRLDSGDWTTYSGPVTISGNGPHTLEHRATDVAGNVGQVGSGTYTISGGGAGAPTVQAFADPESGPAPLHVHFSAAGLDPDGGALEYEWTLGDGTVLDSEFDYTFTQPGTYTATVKVTDPEGKTASDDVTVTVQPAGGGNAAPTVTASADKPSGPAPHTVAFTATGSDDRPVSELEYRWEFGDGGVSFERSPSHRYMVKGNYTATVTVTDAGDKTGTATVPITVTDPPGNRAPTVKAGAAPKSGTAPLSVLLTASGSDPDGDALTYSWDYGDGSTGTGKKVTHVYSSGGTYTATVTARDPGGMTGTATVSIVVGNPPGNQAPTVQIAADPAGGNAPLSVRFSASGRDPDGDPIMYVWDFGDGGKAGGKSATHTYTQPGTYTAKVTVTDSHNATGTATVQVVVQPAAQGQVRGAQAELAVPRSVRAFVRRGLRVKVTCVRSGAGRARLTVSRANARRLALGSRTVASRQLRCRAGRDVSVRLKPSRRTARRLAGAQTLRLTLRVAVKGSRAVSRRVTIR